MTAAILQFNQHTKQTHSDYIETPMTKEYHQIMIDLLNTDHPFRAVRLATEFNRENGFSLIDVAIIRKWKKEIMKKENVEISFENCQNEILKNENRQIDFCQNDFINIKKLKYEKAFQDLLEN